MVIIIDESRKDRTVVWADGYLCYGEGADRAEAFSDLVTSVRELVDIYDRISSDEMHPSSKRLLIELRAWWNS